MQKNVGCEGCFYEEKDILDLYNKEKYKNKELELKRKMAENDYNYWVQLALDRKEEIERLEKRLAEEKEKNNNQKWLIRKLDKDGIISDID